MKYEKLVNKTQLFQLNRKYSLHSERRVGEVRAGSRYQGGGDRKPDGDCCQSLHGAGRPHRPPQHHATVAGDHPEPEEWSVFFFFLEKKRIKNKVFRIHNFPIDL